MLVVPAGRAPRADRHQPEVSSPGPSLALSFSFVAIHHSFRFGLVRAQVLSPMTKVEIESVAADHTIGSAGPVGVLVWTGVATEEGTQRFDQVLERLCQAHEQVGFVVIIESSGATSPPPEGPRKAMIEMLKRHSDKLAACSLVFEGDGFRASTIRVVMSAVLLATGNNGVDTKIHRDGASASKWVAEKLGSVADSDVESAIDKVRYVAEASA